MRSAHCCQWYSIVPPVISISTYWQGDKMADIMQMTLFKYNIFNKNDYILIKILQKFVSQGPNHRCFRWWLGAKQVASHYLNQWWHSLVMHICITWPQKELTCSAVIFCDIIAQFECLLVHNVETQSMITWDIWTKTYLTFESAPCHLQAQLWPKSCPTKIRDPHFKSQHIKVGRKWLIFCIKHF